MDGFSSEEESASGQSSPEAPEHIENIQLDQQAAQALIDMQVDHIQVPEVNVQMARDHQQPSAQQSPAQGPQNINHQDHIYHQQQEHIQPENGQYGDGPGTPPTRPVTPQAGPGQQGRFPDMQRQQRVGTEQQWHQQYYPQQEWQGMYGNREYEHHSSQFSQGRQDRSNQQHRGQPQPNQGHHRQEHQNPQQPFCHQQFGGQGKAQYAYMAGQGQSSTMYSQDAGAQHHPCQASGTNREYKQSSGTVPRCNSGTQSYGLEPPRKKKKEEKIGIN